jgi:hypothetical protein
MSSYIGKDPNVAEVILNQQFHGAMVKLSADVVSPTLPYTVSWDAEEYDTSNFHESVTNPTRLTIPAGVVKARLHSYIRASNVLAASDFRVFFKKNGVADAGFVPAMHSEVPGTFTTFGISVISAPLVVSAGDYFEVVVSSNDTTITLDSAACNFSIESLETNTTATFHGAKVEDLELVYFSETANKTVASLTGALAVDLTDGGVQSITLTENITSVSFSNAPPSGQLGTVTLFMKQDATGSRTVTWPASILWAGGTDLVLSTAANAMDVVSFMTKDGGATWYGRSEGLDFK